MSLILLVLLPIIGAIIIFGPWFPQNEVKIRRFAKGWAGLVFIYSLFFIAFFNPSQTGFQFENILKLPGGKDWIAPLGIDFAFGVDGISITLLVLTTFLVLISLIA
ncbi:MAG TPA: hypothetical protein DDW90_01965, partial [Cyanobacteria bacterium UBA9971]|nr:hypothetical protein [Cyanobacteria bacterium UBA9971]